MYFNSCTPSEVVTSNESIISRCMCAFSDVLRHAYENRASTRLRPTNQVRPEHADLYKGSWGPVLSIQSWLEFALNSYHE